MHQATRLSLCRAGRLLVILTVPDCCAIAAGTDVGAMVHQPYGCLQTQCQLHDLMNLGSDVATVVLLQEQSGLVSFCEEFV